LSRRSLFWIVMAAVGLGLVLLLLNDSSEGGLGFSSDHAGSALYLGAWGAVVAAGILGSGRRLGDIARNLGLWMLAILALVAVYQYRYELQDFASRITAGLVPGSPLSVGDDGNTVMLEKLANGHFGARGAVNGKPVDFIIDTGASATVLTPADARAAGFDTATLSFTVPVQTANGMAKAAVAVADTVSVGTISRARVPVFIVGPGQLDQSLLGMNFIGTLSGFDVRGDRMILRD
jgi:aspartyl protease family protein